AADYASAATSAVKRIADEWLPTRTVGALLAAPVMRTAAVVTPHPEEERPCQRRSIAVQIAVEA
ncbi:MAG: hypothetical protein M3354_07370, partial [Chloroflexota bacterium]|nr:hypothetical protein [Chloroflexota bacterium]